MLANKTRTSDKLVRVLSERDCADHSLGLISAFSFVTAADALEPR